MPMATVWGRFAVGKRRYISLAVSVLSFLAAQSVPTSRGFSAAASNGKGKHAAQRGTCVLAPGGGPLASLLKVECRMNFFR